MYSVILLPAQTPNKYEGGFTIQEIINNDVSGIGLIPNTFSDKNYTAGKQNYIEIVNKDVGLISPTNNNLVRIRYPTITYYESLVGTEYQREMIDKNIKESAFLWYS